MFLDGCFIFLELCLRIQERGNWSDNWRCKLSHEDELLLRHRRSLMLQVRSCQNHGPLLALPKQQGPHKKMDVH